MKQKNAFRKIKGFNGLRVNLDDPDLPKCRINQDTRGLIPVIDQLMNWLLQSPLTPSNRVPEKN